MQLRRIVGLAAGPDAGPERGSKYARYALELDASASGLAGKRILEIGSDPDGELLRECLERFGARSGVGVNPALAGKSRIGEIELLAENAAEMPFQDNSFEVIASLSVFEHVHDLPGVLSECFRVLAPGGILYTEFGPIWSSCWGHHLWFWHGASVIDWRSHRLPPYAHLLMTPTELRAWCDDQFDDPEVSKRITDFVFHSDQQNRLFYSDYERIMSESPFETVFICGEPDVPHPDGTPASDYVDTFRRLSAQFPGRTGFGYHLVRALLTKPAP